MRRHNALRGFTLTELMVVIVVIGILLALLIPVVQRARESARRAQCASHCNEIQTAILQFAVAKDRLPYSITLLPGRAQTPPPICIAAGWVPQILAYLGRNDLYQIYASNTATATATGTIYIPAADQPGPAGYMFIQYLETMVCPSDTAKPTTAVSATATNLGVGARAPLSYAVNAGYPDQTTSAAYPLDFKENGLFFNPWGYTSLGFPAGPVTDLTYVSKNDGTATTILLGENMDATFWAYFDGDNTAPAVLLAQNSYGAVYSAEDPQALVWMDAAPGSPTAVTSPIPPLGLNQGYKGLQPGDPNLVVALQQAGKGYSARPSSPHPGGFHITFADGHTILMSQDATYQIYAELMTPRGACARPSGSGWYVPGSNPNPVLHTWQTAPVSSNSFNL